MGDDFYACTRHAEVGLPGAMRESLLGTGAVRPARFLELLLLASLCGRVPFGLLVLLPLGLTLAVAFLLRGLLLDLGARRPWPEIGAALWLLGPLGVESAVWTSALHVPLGIALSLLSLRLYRRERFIPAGLLALGSFLSLEQMIFAMPFAAFLVTPTRRMRSLISSGTVMLAVLIADAIWPGQNERTAIALTERATALFQDPSWYVKFPIAGLGVHSIPLAAWWALPFSVAVLLFGGWLGVRFGRALTSEGVASDRSEGASSLRILMAALILALLINLPVMATVPRGISGRIFAPTWLLLAAIVPLIGDRQGIPRAGWLWAAGGVLGAGALLSIAFCVSVRLHTDDFTRASSEFIGARLTQANEVVDVCGIRRTVVSPAPVGSIAQHELFYDWSARAALEFYTGKSALFRLSGPLWGTPCRTSDADLVVHFDQLRAAAGLDPSG
jgi:hypothetical protein